MILQNGIEHLRDPFILVENGVYYAYGTGIDTGSWASSVWDLYINKSGRLDGEWKHSEKPVYINPPHAVQDHWAPEVHKYKGRFYMFATYRSDLTEHHGCTILRADSPEGPFAEITDGTITPRDWDSIDGTLYVDKAGTPWMIFVHEWTSTDDGVGRMAAAKLSEDLTHFVSEPVELFRGDAPSWAAGKITDGCFLYDTVDGNLLMLWSNFDMEGKYCVGIAHSENGKVDGTWIQEPELLFSSKMTGNCDGGHGMIFKALDGNLYLSIHSPNDPAFYKQPEKMIFVPVKEQNGTLVCEV